MFDVFLSYNSKNAAVVSELVQLLGQREVRPWWDKEQVPAGTNIFTAMRAGLTESACCAIFIGPDGLGKYQTEEIWQALNQRIQSGDSDEYRVIPVLLPGTDDRVEQDLPVFLNYYSRVQFRDAISEAEPLDRLVAAIKRRDLTELSFLLERDDTELEPGSYAVSLSVNSKPVATERVNLDFPSDSTAADAIAKVRSGGADRNDIALAGVELWGRLSCGSIRDALDDLPRWGQYNLRLRLPPELEWLPWECFYDEERVTYLASDERYSIIRDVQTEPDFPPRSRRAQGPIKVLIAAPEGGQVDYATESRQISDVMTKRLGNTVSIEKPAGPITLEQLDTMVQGFDVFHFMGHGRIAETGEPELLFNDSAQGGERWVDAETFSSLFSHGSVRLVVLNCCFSGGMSAAATRSGFGPTLLRRGVPAVIAMQFEVREHIARGFAELLYEFLVSNPMPGRIDYALRQTRRRLRQRFSDKEPRAFLTPQLFLAKGLEKLLDVARPYVRPAAPAASMSGRVQLPDGLIKAMIKGRCVPIVGPGVLNAGAVRRPDTPAPVVPGPRELAQRLEQRLLEKEKPLPERGHELGLYKHLGDWIEITELQRVCQYYSQSFNRAELIDEIVDVYGAISRPGDAFLLMAKWPVPAFICTFIDGMLEDALSSTSASVSVVTSVDQPIDDVQSTLLVNLRGTWKSPRDLVLTEREEHDLLWNRFGRMNSKIASLLTGVVGRSPLYVGCSPRDTLVRRLSFQLMPDVSSNNLGDIFFLTSEISPVDRFYWQTFPPNVQWIECDLEAAIEELSERLGDKE